MERNSILPPEDKLLPRLQRISEQRRAQRRRTEGQPENETSNINVSTSRSMDETILRVLLVSPPCTLVLQSRSLLLGRAHGHNSTEYADQ